MTINTNNNLIIPRNNSTDISLSWEEITNICLTQDPLSAKGQQVIAHLKGTKMYGESDLLELFSKCLKEKSLNLKMAEAFVCEEIIQPDLISEINGRSPLHIAALHGKPKLLDLLMEGTLIEDINQQDSLSETPLHLACHRGHIICATLLMNHGANPNICNKEDWSPLDEAVFNSHFDLIDKIIEFALNKGIRLNVSQCCDTLDLFAKLGNVQLIRYTKQISHFFSIPGDIQTGYLTCSLESYPTERMLSIHADFWKLFAQSQPPARIWDEVCEIAKHIRTVYKDRIFKTDEIIDRIRSKKIIVVPVESPEHLAFLVFSDNYVFKCDRSNDKDSGIAQFKIGTTKNTTLREAISLIELYQDSDKAVDYFDVEINQTLQLSPVANFAQKPLSAGICTWANGKSAFYAILIALFQKHRLKDALIEARKCYKTFTAFTRKSGLISYLKLSEVDIPFLNTLLDTLKNPQKLKNHLSNQEKISFIQAIQKRIAKELQTTAMRMVQISDAKEMELVPDHENL